MNFTTVPFKTADKTYGGFQNSGKSASGKFTTKLAASKVGKTLKEI